MNILLNKDGYDLLSNMLSKEEINFGLSSIQNNNKIDYSIMKRFIDKIFLYKIKNKSKIITDPYYVKFRFSNNNNSSDASTFHGDIYNNSNSELLPIYTCLCYFDDAQVEIIPGSHKYNNNGWSIENYNKKKIINVHRGDILIFHANLHHRGINYNKTSNRRLLQVFEVFPNKETYNNHHTKLVIVQSSNSFFVKNLLNPITYQISKYTKIIDYITFIHYILMYNDLQYKVALMDISPYEKKNKYISYEPGKRVYFENLINKIEDLNVNIVCDKKINSISYGNYYMYIYIIFLFTSLLVVYTITKILYVNGIYKNKTY
jgi:hypothetical protein